MRPYSKYNSEVAAWLKEIQPKWYVLSEICRRENIQPFITAVKAYIDDAGYDIYFSSDYKKLRKIDISGFLTKTTET